MAEHTRAFILQLNIWDGIGSRPFHAASHYREHGTSFNPHNSSWGPSETVPLCDLTTYCDINLKGQLIIECNCGLLLDSGRTAGRALIPQAILAAFLVDSIVPRRDVLLNTSQVRQPLGQIISFTGIDGCVRYAFGGMTMYRGSSTSCRLFVRLPSEPNPFAHYLPWALEEYLIEVNRIQREASHALRNLLHSPR